MASVVVIASGAALAISVPFLALKELLEKRTQNNFKRHLGRRSACRVHFGSVDDVFVAAGQGKKFATSRRSSCDDDVASSSSSSSPPAYDDLFHPPPAYQLSGDVCKK